MRLWTETKCFMHVAYLHYSAHYVFTNTKNDIYKHCSSLASSTCTTYNRSCDDARTFEQHRTKSKWLWKRWRREHKKKERGTNNSIYYSAYVKLTLHQVKNVSNAQQLRKASLLSLLLHEKFTCITEVTTAQILLCWTKHDLYIAKEKRSRKLVHRKILYINKKDICI